MRQNPHTDTTDLMEPGTVSTGTGLALVALFLAALAAVPILQTLDESRQARHLHNAPHISGLEGEPPPPPAPRLSPLTPDTRHLAPSPRAIAAANARLLTLMQNFETNLEDQSWLARTLRAPTQLFLTRVLGAGNEQAYPGRDNWVYYRGDVDYVTAPGFLTPRHRATGHGGLGPTTAHRHHDPLAAIVEFDKTLRAHGITLLVMPVPTKPTLQPGGLNPRVAHNLPPPQNPSFDLFLRQLQDSDVQVFDPTPILATLHPAYLAGDTHWRPDAMQAVAKSLATKINALNLLPPALSAVERAHYRQTQTQIACFGDTTVMLGLPPSQNLYPRESVTLAPVLDTQNHPWQRTPGAEVLLLGDSFANIFSQPSMGWGASAGLAEQLAFHLQRPLDRIVQNDNGAHATRELFLQRLPAPSGVEGANDTAPPPRLIIWEFTQRELASGDWKLLATP